MKTLEDYIEKYGEKDGLRRWKGNERNRQNYYKNKERILKRRHEYYIANREKLAEYFHQYNIDNHEKRAAYSQQYHIANREKIIERVKKWQKDNPDKVLKKNLKWNCENPKHSRANKLFQNYRKQDQKANRGACTLTVKWIMENIFNGQHCIYCGESDWHLLGCDRINNSMPHTPDNVVVCCGRCNKKRSAKGFLEFALRHIGAKESDGLSIK